MDKETIRFKYRFWFDSRHLQDDLKAKSVSGGISTTANQFISFGLNLVSTFILARILLPSDFGLVGMVTAFTGFAHIIKDLGLSTAVIQKERITPKQVSNLFWINVFICVAIAIIFVSASPFIVSLYHHDTRIYPILFSYAVGIIISGLALQHNALMVRKMLFSRLAKGNILASLLSVLCGIGAALLGWGYWAIVVMNLSLDLFNTCFVWYLCDWRPSFFRKKKSVLDFVRFGMGLSGSNIINYFSKNADDIIIGSAIGPTAVGFYSKAYQLLMLPINQLRTPLTLVATPALSALKNNTWRFVNYYRKYLFILAFFSMPLVACLAIFSKELVVLVLGSQWVETSHIFQILAIAGFILPVAQSRGLILIATGQTKRLMYLSFFLASITILGFFVGIRWGITGVAWSLSVTTYLSLVPSLYYTFKYSPVKLSSFFDEIALPTLHSLLIAGFIFYVRLLCLTFLSPLVVFFLAAPIGMVAYYFSWKLYPFGRRKLIAIEELGKIITEKIKQKTVRFAPSAQ